MILVKILKMLYHSHKLLKCLVKAICCYSYFLNKIIIIFSNDNNTNERNYIQFSQIMKLSMV